MKLVKNAIQFLAEQFINNGSIEKKDIFSSINKFMIKETNNKIWNQNIEYIIKTPKKSVIPRSERQKNYVKSFKAKAKLLFQQAQLVQEKLF